jgi:hypothetical protein
MGSEIVEKRLTDVSHEHCAEESEEEDPGEDERPVGASFIEQPSRWIKMRQVEEFGSV